MEQRKRNINPIEEWWKVVPVASYPSSDDCFPSYHGKLQFPCCGMLIVLPAKASRGVGHVFTGDKPVRMDVLVDAGQTIGEALTDPARHLDVLELAIETPAVNSLLFEGESNEAMLIDLYIFEGVADSAGCRKK